MEKLQLKIVHLNDIDIKMSFKAKEVQNMHYFAFLMQGVVGMTSDHLTLKERSFRIHGKRGTLLVIK